MAYNCKIIADSISPTGKRLTTFEVTFPRIVLAEAKTHRVFSGLDGNVETDFNNLGINDDKNLSRNSASSRAIPFIRQLQKVEKDPFIPERFPINNKGMQPTTYYTAENNLQKYRQCEYLWLAARDSAVESAALLAETYEEDGSPGLSVHKQIVNRLLEPFMWHTAIITATEFNNFFSQRCDENAQYEIKRIADLMYEAYHLADNVGAEFISCKQPELEICARKELKEGEWHLPYIYEDDWKIMRELTTFGNSCDPVIFTPINTPIHKEIILNQLKAISVARCARVSYLNQNGKRDLQSDLDLYFRFVEGNHWSPFEHVATPHLGHDLEKFNEGHSYNKKDKNFIGWKQFRSSFKNENVTEFRKETKE